MGICMSICEGCGDPLPKSRERPLEEEDIKVLEIEKRKDEQLACLPGRICVNGSTANASIYSQQGKKGINQDCMLVWEDFGNQEDTVFCGVFDGHGPHGHLVARRVRDSLPSTIIDQWQEQIAADSSSSNGNQSTDSSELTESNVKDDSDLDKDKSRMYSMWKESHLRAFEVMDEALQWHPILNCSCSGTTAVTVIKQDQDLVIANVGDSRAILGTLSDDNKLMAVQLTRDLKPNVPQEAERIRLCRGRVFSSEDEPEVYRVWLPNDDSPGLAMARAFGDFCLKDFGVIAVPEITYRHLTSRDQFVVLATDGVWDVLTNEEVVRIVSSAPREEAAKVVVQRAVRGWKRKYPTSRMDDCATVCLYVDSQSAVRKDNHEHLESMDVNVNDTSQNNAVSSNTVGEEKTENPSKQEGQNNKESRRTLAECIATDEWSALDGMSRVNSLLRLPRFIKGDEKI
ncbi:hypothetical protein SUGI_0140420 [Cryptomeria japonica]|uniref:probable protein phosphatase 2C 33 n=1 Tax=Cryptomeria japonica TaxID=3369 RepID=UPI002408DC2A|nr:probable protein phosphatase 2C 33 [Cryptomeria japonica]XP_059072562.1 probable protein phosphatase 2C 33 [Cryptomeria japonica]XP_059072563.1 probable protein phosphatase 2C 33 [Cryptomeria japonica]GLJ11015.1 hypothetical protein SUGI_0140420 [Cryptomeria japonica]